MMTIHPRSHRTQGFTIVELLIVIVVIAILAAISIVAYNGIQDRARESLMKSELSTASKKLELYAIDEGKLPNTTGSQDAVDMTFSFPVGIPNVLLCGSNSDLAAGFTIIARDSDYADDWYMLDSTTDQVSQFTPSGSLTSSANLCSFTSHPPLLWGTHWARSSA
jgi:general secretion pathway protein G